ncbi:MAG TPA: anti-sigma factor [Thermoanaerobaculia bacterium]|nr:anti-sigma factor [Thermoanaerobaculia bacterium]
MSSDHKPEHEELLALYALGSLDGEDLERLEAHLRAGCVVCHRQLSERLGEAAALAEAVEEVMPRPGTREELIRRLNFETSGHGYGVIGDDPLEETTTLDETAPGTASSAWVWRLAAMLLLAAGLGIFLWGRSVESGLRDDLTASENRAEALVSQLEEREAEIAALGTRLAATQAALTSIASADQVQLAGLGSGGGAQGRLYAGERGLLIVVDGLPSPDAEHVYQLWRIADGQPYPAGLLESTDGTSFLWTTAAAPNAVDVWAVTLEPEGGVARPTGEIVLSS